MIHRLAHIHSAINPLWLAHRHHHRNVYGNADARWPSWHEYFLWFGNWPKTIDVWITFIVPLIAVVVGIGGSSWLLIPLYYLYEVFLSDRVLEHNPHVTGPVTQVFAVGTYHLAHHFNIRGNYAFFITLWDRVFGTKIADEKPIDL